MSTPIKVRVKNGKRGFIYGVFRHGAVHSDKGKTIRESDVFTLIPVEYTHKLDDNGKPLIKSPEQQFSSKWMERISKAPVEPEPEKKASVKKKKASGK